MAEVANNHVHKNGKAKGARIIHSSAIDLADLQPHVEDTSADKVSKNVPYKRWGSDNLFPNVLARLNRRAPNHRGIMNWKVIYLVGGGLICDEGEDIEQEIQFANMTGESLTEVSEKLFTDHKHSGNAFIYLVTDARRTFLSVFHQDYTKVRYGIEGDKFVLHPKWSKWSSSKDQTIDVPIYPNFQPREDGFLHCMVHVMDYEPGFKWYGVPRWLAAIDAAAIAYKTNKWNVSRLDNSFASSGVLLLNGNMSDEDAKELTKEIKDNFTGETKTGKLQVIVREPGETVSTEFTPINEDYEGDFIDLHDQSTADLITNHSWFRSLSGIADNTGFDVSRIRNEYEVAANTVIPREQKPILDALKRIYSEQLGLNCDSLRFAVKPPVGYAEDIDVNRTLTVRQGLELLGQPADEEREDLDNIIADNGGNTTNGTNNEGGGD